uniref:Uncharacterized protein n=1 Tax=Alloyangia mangrovi TaxID=1779329 RepID=A0A2A3K076_9RHOB
MPERSFGKTIRTLLLALLNATLILVALCLFLALQLGNRIEGITSSFARTLVSVDPLREELGSMTSELVGLRGDLAALRAGSGETTSEAAQKISARLDKLETRLDNTSQRIEGLLSNPEQLIDHAVDRTAEEIKQGLGTLRGCTPPEGLTLLEPHPLPPRAMSLQQDQRG